MENSEQLLGVIPAKKYAIYVTDKRLAFIKNPSDSAGALIGGALGGPWGAVIVGTIQKKLESGKRKTLDVDELLRKDKKNYTLAHDELESVVFYKSQWSKLDPVRLIICSKNGKQEANVELTPKEAEQMFNVFSSISALSGKVREQYS